MASSCAVAPAHEGNNAVGRMQQAVRRQQDVLHLEECRLASLPCWGPLCAPVLCLVRKGSKGSLVCELSPASHLAFNLLPAVQVRNSGYNALDHAYLCHTQSVTNALCASDHTMSHQASPGTADRPVEQAIMLLRCKLQAAVHATEHTCTAASYIATYYASNNTRSHQAFAGIRRDTHLRSKHSCCVYKHLRQQCTRPRTFMLLPTLSQMYSTPASTPRAAKHCTSRARTCRAGFEVACTVTRLRMS
eukprot:scaffold45131_cov24-Tisochrysis_lutea.AAC.2